MQLGANANSAIPVFIRCLQDRDWRVAAAGADGLAAYTIEPKMAVPALVDALSSRTNALARSAAEGDPYHWHGDISVRYAAARALREYADVMRRGRFEYFAPMQKSFADPYREAMPAAIGPLVKAMGDRDWRVAREAADALGAAVIEPEVVVPALVSCLDYPYADVRIAVIGALANYGEAARPAVPALTRIAQGDPRGYAGGGFAANALKKIAPENK